MIDNVIGIDAGVAGALALVGRDGGLIEAVDMPSLRDGPSGRASVNAPLLAEIIARWPARSAVVGYVGARPGEQAVGAFLQPRSRIFEAAPVAGDRRIGPDAASAMSAHQAASMGFIDLTLSSSP